jgi:TldD protein
MSVFIDVKNKVAENIQRIAASDAGYCDARWYQDDSSEQFMILDGNLEANDTTVESGLGVRVLYRGAWGFAATSRLDNIDRCFDRAMANAVSASKLVKVKLDMGHMAGHTGEYCSPFEIDPFEVDLSEKVDFLKSVDEALKESWILRRMIRVQLQRMIIHFWSSEGTYTKRTLVNAFAHMTAMGLDGDRQMQRRSKSLYCDPRGTRGWEMLTNPDLWSGHTVRIKDELKQVLAAPELEFGKRSVILLPGQGHLQVHETIGHPLELDRILGYELSYAGGSFVDLDSFGKLRYGSEKLSVSAYGSIENSPGTFGYDDEGTPERDYLLIDKGLLVNCLTSRAMISEANQRAGRPIFTESGGASRSTAFYKAPIDRMTNVNILPGSDGTLDDIVSTTEDGIIVDNPTSWSIGSNREHFHFGCEIAWEVKNGRITRILRNPSYQGHTVEFYNKLTAVGNESTWTVEQVENCGKGEPNQVMELGHGVPVIRFDDVITGERR